MKFEINMLLSHMCLWKAFYCVSETPETNAYSRSIIFLRLLCNIITKDIFLSFFRFQIIWLRFHTCESLFVVQLHRILFIINKRQERHIAMLHYNRHRKNAGTYKAISWYLRASFWRVVRTRRSKKTGKIVSNRNEPGEKRGGGKTAACCCLVTSAALEQLRRSFSHIFPQVVLSPGKFCLRYSNIPLCFCKPTPDCFRRVFLPYWL